MGRGQPPPSMHIDASDFHSHFVSKVADIDSRCHCTHASLPYFSSPPSCALKSFSHVTVDQVASTIRRLPGKYSYGDPMPTSLLKACVDLLSPFIAYLFNASLTSGIFLTSWKHASVTPVPKKINHDPLDVNSYRPISNLPVLSRH